MDLHLRDDMIELGSRDAAAILGVSPHRTPWRCYAEHVGLLPVKDEPNEAMAWGLELEDVVAARFMATVLGDDLDEVTAMSPDTRRYRWTWCRATPDVLIQLRGAPALIEVKCVREEPPKQPRVDWLVQCLHHRLVFPEAQQLYLVAFGALHMEWWEIPAHQGALDRVLREEERFLERIEKQEPPPVRAADASVLARAWPITTPEPVVLEGEASEWARILSEARRGEKEWQARGALAEAHLKQALGPHERGVLPAGGSVSFKPYQREAYLVPQATIRPLKVTLPKEESA